MEKTKRIRQANFSYNEELTLVTAVIDRYDLLFGNYKGSGRCHGTKADTWQAIADAVNAVSITQRTVEGVEKKFNNIKQSAKVKKDEQRNPPTGGGRPVQMTPAEVMWVDAMEARMNPTLHGIHGGMDVNEQRVAVAENPPVAEEYTCTDFSFDPATESIIFTLPSTTTISSTSTVSTTASSISTCPPASTSSSISTCPPASTSSSLMRQKRKRKSEMRENIERDILQLEKEKLALEIKYMKDKATALEERRRMWGLKERFYKKMLNRSEEEE